MLDVSILPWHVSRTRFFGGLSRQRALLIPFHFFLPFICDLMDDDISLSGDENGFKNISSGTFIAKDGWKRTRCSPNKELFESGFASFGTQNNASYNSRGSFTKTCTVPFVSSLKPLCLNFQL